MFPFHVITQSDIKSQKYGPNNDTKEKINSSWIEDLIIISESIKFQRENIGEKFCDIGFSNDFLSMTPKSQATKAKINTWAYIKIKFLHSKGNNKQ